MAQRKTKLGYVYIFTNASMHGLLKIGETTRTPEKRAKELSSSTGVPTPFEVAYQRKVSNCHEAEQKIHWQLHHVRVNGKEFFQLPLSEAIHVVNEICDKYPINKVVTPPPPIHDKPKPNNNPQNQTTTPPIFTPPHNNPKQSNNTETKVVNSTAFYLPERGLFGVNNNAKNQVPPPPRHNNEPKLNTNTENRAATPPTQIKIKPNNNDQAIKPYTNGCVGCLMLYFFGLVCFSCIFRYVNTLPPVTRSVIEPIATLETPLITATAEILPTPTTETLPTATVEILPTPTLYSEAENPPKEPQIVWIYQLQGISTDVSRWEVWTEAVEPQVKGYMTWNEFKEEVLLHNPHLDKNNPVFHPNEVYVMPGLQ